MPSKVCFKCQKDKDLSEFYAHSRMADGHLNKCKECTKSDSTKNRRDDPEKRAAYERERFQRPERKAQMAECQKKRREKNPEKTKAWMAVHRAKKSGRLVPKPCEVCGDEKVQAHHDDYLKPLDVRWLCFKHHREHEHNHKTTTCANGAPATIAKDTEQV